MSPIAIMALAVGMSIDALFASIGRGAASGRPKIHHSMGTGVVFGVFAAAMPVIGWGTGVVASQYIAIIDHWIAFGLLTCVGGRMVHQGLQRAGEQDSPEFNASLVALLAVAIGTSMDAMAVGVSLAFLDVDIIVIAAAIGLATFLMSTGGMMAGRMIGTRFGVWAEVAAGIGLIVLGLSILIEHLSA